MSIKRSAVQMFALLAAVILGVFILLGAARAELGVVQTAAALAVLVIGLFGLSLATAFTTRDQLFMAVIYLLIACTFLNNAFFAIHLGFFSLFLYRILLIAAGCLHFAGMLRNRTHIQRWNRLNVKGILLFFAFWFIYGLISLLWAKSVTEGIKYLALLAMGIFMIYLIVMYIQKMERILIFYTIWLVMTVVLMGIGIYNNITLHHLPTSTLYNGPEYKQHYPTSVFFNQNDFATFLSISFFFYLTMAKNIKNGYLKGIGLLLSLCALYLIILTGSRASLLGVFAGAAVYIFILLPSVLKKAAIWLSAVGCAAFAILFANRIFSVFWKLFLAPQTAHSFDEPLPSNVARANLLKNAWHYVLDTYGFGVGAGNVSYYLKHYALYDTDQVVEVHNWLVEIMANFGLIMMLGYLTVYLYLIWTLYKLYERKMDNWSKLVIEGLITALVSFLVSSISPSSVSNLFFHWVFLALVIAAVNVMRRSKHEQSEPVYR
ncbi:teichuronic acid biosynthesis protein TuaE [Bacillus atrophaeus]|uniref:teichuronic acid biosynthesis protein TuaE n=1 Tax=Bacillus atrophaeus TaxID=1452 RepID=UPI001BAB4DFA|nr:O-antigen ligase family protein [Bacillus atrophaeus]MDL5143138.1 O-antigen ligase family protein [Bacillus atrophaeus]MED1017586.1 O-antigen ligase family protein [Bacillus atrophaeus]MED1031931.1 O-antigen ligase family protein [Bacillus atrophaeus]MED1119070.1 O-antigen ligase family protein [Bacillus atrophaeus]MED1121738.1 O-antigen ligase family protein [Bacillus atrophaeus]